MHESDCHIVRGLFAAKLTDGDDASNDQLFEEVSGLEGVGPRLETAAGVNDFLNQDQDAPPSEAAAPPDQGPAAPDDGVLDQEILSDLLQRRFALWEVEPGQEHEIAAALSPRFRGGPVHGFGRLNHLTKRPGTPPRASRAPDSTPTLPKSSPGKAVAVVDSGVTDQIPDWLASGIDLEPENDLETLPNADGDKASHGVFVAGLIRRIAPEHTIYMARTMQRPVDKFTGHSDPGHDPTTELDVAVAIGRLVRRLRSDNPRVDALNLSLGASSCSECDPTMVVLQAGLSDWHRAFPKSEVFAAGGNHPGEGALYPAAWPGVRAVGAAADGGRQKVWDDNATELDAGPRWWITDVAPGVGLTGPGGSKKDDWIEWNGSSFATAVATACFASCRPSEVVGDLTYWSDHQTDYTDIPGL